MKSTAFYIDLFSNASLDIFPDNTMATFSVQLPVPLSFPEPYEVALCSYIVPNNFAILQEKGGVYISTRPESVEQKLHGTRDWEAPHDRHLTLTPESKIPTSTDEGGVQTYTPEKVVASVYYTWNFDIPKDKIFQSEDDLLVYINALFKESKFFHGVLATREIASNREEYKFPFTIRKAAAGLEVILRDHALKVALQGSVTQLLGIPSDSEKFLSFEAPGIYHFPLARPDIKVSVPRFLNIYLSCIEPIITADTKSPLLKTIDVPLSKKEFLSDIVSREVISRAYLPVNVSSLQVLSIEIRDPGGSLARFLYGLVHLRLHFRPVRD